MHLNITTEEHIKRLRSFLLIHSHIYYRLNDSIVSDYEFDSAANKLVDLQREHKGVIGWYDEAFEGFDGSTGFDLPYDHWIASKANWCVLYHEKHHEEHYKITEENNE